MWGRAFCTDKDTDEIVRSNIYNTDSDFAKNAREWVKNMIVKQPAGMKRGRSVELTIFQA